MWIRYGSGSVDPYPLTYGSESCSFPQLLQDINNKKNFPKLSFLLLFEGTFTSVFKYKKSQKVIKLEKSRLFYFVCLMEGSGSVQISTYPEGPKTDGSFESGSTTQEITK
jgi:hypothetical protein